ncbi:hypothetical protein [Paracoccus laeviglucosivorans]|uniref:hypothetical protein n=1 Tax=Paracoccus laeviglucosivorans TaxID=1197861 RepID=UPI001FE36E9B|nr:hypothetical protein [Paracoccus laeviglucosivorans]
MSKWGGRTRCPQVASLAFGAVRTNCLHFLGAGIGLFVAAHVLTAVGGPGLLDVDVNPNPLRHAFFDPTSHMLGGRWQISDAPALGIDALPMANADYRTLRREAPG